MSKSERIAALAELVDNLTARVAGLEQLVAQLDDRITERAGEEAEPVEPAQPVGGGEEAEGAPEAGGDGAQVQPADGGEAPEQPADQTHAEGAA